MNVRRLHPDMERWMVEEGYAKALNVGADEDDVGRAPEIAAEEGDEPARSLALRTWTSVRERSGSGA